MADIEERPDPCGVWPALEKIRRRILAGSAVPAEDFWGAAEKTWRPSDLPELGVEIHRLQVECFERSSGRRAGRRSFFGSRQTVAKS